jgi:hypothetical protein
MRENICEDRRVIERNRFKKFLCQKHLCSESNDEMQKK